MNLQKQPSWLKEIELLALTAVIVGANTFLSATHIIDPTVATAISTALTGGVLLAFGHKLGLNSVPVATLENTVQQIIGLVAPAPAQPTSTPPLAAASPAAASSPAPAAPAQTVSAG